MNLAKPSHHISSARRVGVIFGRLSGRSYLRDLWDLISWGFVSVMFLVLLAIVFLTLGPKEVISQHLALWTASYTVPVLCILVALKLSEPALRVRGYNWHYGRIYIVLALFVGAYASLVNLVSTNLLGFFVVSIIALLALSLFPAIRDGLNKTRQISFAFSVAVLLLFTPATQVGRINATLEKLSSRSSLIEPTKEDSSYGTSKT